MIEQAFRRLDRNSVLNARWLYRRPTARTVDRLGLRLRLGLCLFASTRVQASPNIFSGLRVWPKPLCDFAVSEVLFTGIFALCFAMAEVDCFRTAWTSCGRVSICEGVADNDALGLVQKELTQLTQFVSS